MATRSTLRFLLNDTPIELSDVRASVTLLDYLRLERRLTGTKEGCNEGDCGACTVLVGRLRNGELSYESLNACIRFVGSLDGCHVVTVEHLAAGDSLHPVQQALVDHHGSQCGFCTPGIVMSLYALWMRTPSPSEAEIETALQGNLCRCTGYEPIIKAAKAASTYGSPQDDPLTTERERVTAQLQAWRDDHLVEVTAASPLGDEERFFVPQTTEQLADVLDAHPTATIVAGATDVGLWVNKDHRAITPAVFIGNLGALQTIEVKKDAVTIGGGVSYSDFMPVLKQHFSHLEELWWRVGGEQVRNMGTIGGNIANGSPIGDSPPGFIALGARLTLRSKAGARSLPLEDFFLAYGKQDLRPGEFVEALTVPIPQNGTHNGVYKISKRRDEDISALCAAFSVTLEGGRISACRIAFGGMAGTPKRAEHTETALLGEPWTMDTINAARPKLAEDYQPLSDWRGTSAYRLLTAQNLLTRFFLEHTTAGEADGAVRLQRDPNASGTVVAA
ncbi:MAG: xanthine dehydrogenase small subunit [Devosiaceae bacterium]|nr:xanthine dehydrogenase small subunit [Devosiaceae bacterium MH13]